MDKPPYEITSEIVDLIASISEKIGEIKANYLYRTSPKLRKENRIKTIHSSLKIEGNLLSESQITALLENKRVGGPKKDIIEVLNANNVYKNLEQYKATDEKSFLNAHSKLMNGLLEHPGKYRTKGIGIIKGTAIAHIAPSAANVSHLMKNLFSYLNQSVDNVLIKSCVFHYEMEFIHPFSDGNGRMGRLWQSLILMEKYPVLGYLPYETLISEDQEGYYSTLAACDSRGSSTLFIVYMLGLLETALDRLFHFNNRALTARERLDYFIALNKKEFSRKDYMAVFKDISAATASRDLKTGTELNLFTKTGKKNQSIYRLKT